MSWLRIKCPKCDRKFDHEYKDGTAVYCPKCNEWVAVCEENKEVKSK